MVFNNNLIVCWGYSGTFQEATLLSQTLTLPYSYTSYVKLFASRHTNINKATYGCSIIENSLSQITVYNNGGITSEIAYFTIGK